MLQQLGAEPPDDRHPVDHLLDELRQAALVAEWLGQRAVMDGPTGPLWGAWERERDRHAKLAKAALDAGLDERRVRLAEENAVAVVGVIRAVLSSVRDGLMGTLSETLRPPAPDEPHVVLDLRDRDLLKKAVNELTVGRKGVETVQRELRKLTAGGAADDTS